MPEKATLRRAKQDKAEGKAATTQAGEFIREEFDHIREGKHGARSAKQAIAIGLSKARRAGVKVPLKKGTAAQGSRKVRARPNHKPSPTRTRATLGALKREGKQAASHTAIARQAKGAARKRTPAERKASARKAARTRARRLASKS